MGTNLRLLILLSLLFAASTLADELADELAGEIEEHGETDISKLSNEEISKRLENLLKDKATLEKIEQIAINGCCATCEVSDIGAEEGRAQLLVDEAFKQCVLQTEP